MNIFDSDRHVMEPLTIWEQYVAPHIFQQFPIKMVLDDPNQAQNRISQYGQQAGIALPPTFTLAAEPILADWDIPLQVASANKKGSGEQRKMAMSGEGQLHSMDIDNIAKAAIFSTFAGFIINHSVLTSEASLAYAQGYNRWLYEYCSVDNRRLKAVGQISRHEPGNMVAQLDKIINNGWKTVTLRPEVIKGLAVGDKAYDDFWAACAQNDIGVAFHGGTHLQANTVGTERFSSRFALHACSHPMEAQMAFVSLLENGVFERYPTLKVAFLEAGASWVPHWLWRLDNICYPEFPELVAQNIKMLPSEYFKRQCWVAVELEEPCLRQTIDIIGADRLLFGTDFPHPDHLDFDVSDIGGSCADLTADEVQLMAEVNPGHFYG